VTLETNLGGGRLSFHDDEWEATHVAPVDADDLEAKINGTGTRDRGRLERSCGQRAHCRNNIRTGQNLTKQSPGAKILGIFFDEPAGPRSFLSS